MTSRKQTDANQRNAQESTGPKTKEGKDRASQNARTHGLTARAVVLSDEESKAYEEQCTSLHDELNPTGSLEILCVNQIAQALWMLTVADGMRVEIFASLRKQLRDSVVIASMTEDVSGVFDDIQEYHSGMIAFYSAKAREAKDRDEEVQDAEKEAADRDMKNTLPRIPLAQLIPEPEELRLKFLARQQMKIDQSQKNTAMVTEGVPLGEAFLFDSTNGNGLEKIERYSTMWMNRMFGYIRLLRAEQDRRLA